jgi:fermentation-respiration switch protein FrsA (DUF1100 family)
MSIIMRNLRRAWLTLGAALLAAGAILATVLPASAAPAVKPLPPVLSTVEVTAQGGDVDPGTTGSVSAFCPAGYSLTGGGFVALNGLAVITSLGNFTANRWTVNVHNPTDAILPGALVQAVCGIVQ